MRTDMECRSLGESRSNYTTDASSVRQIKQKDTSYKKGKKEKGGAGLAVGLIAGAAAGAIAGILLAPEKGTATRRKVSESASKLGDQVTKGFSSTKDLVSDWTGKMKKGQGSESSGAAYSSGTTSATGNVQKSPYTDVNKHTDQEVKDMGNDPRIPGGPGSAGV